MRTTLLVGLLGIAVAMTAGSAEAQGPRAEEARAHFDLGVELLQQGRWNDAIRELEAARAIRVTGPVLYNLGLALRGVGRFRDAISAFRQFLDLVDASAGERRAQVEAYIAELENNLAHLTIRVTPQDARVEVDGRVVREREVVLDPGTYEVRAEASGRDPAEQRVVLDRGGRETVRLDLPLNDSRARIRIEPSVAGAVVIVDGRRLGHGSVDERIAPGEHRILVQADGYEDFERVLELDVGENARVEAELVGESSIFASPWFWIVAGAVVAGGVVATVLLLSKTEDPYVGNLGVVTGVLTAP